MSDRYLNLVNTSLGKQAASSLGLPTPIRLERGQKADEPFVQGNVLIGAGPNPRALDTLVDILKQSKAELFYPKGASEHLAVSDKLTKSSKAKAVELGGEDAPEQKFKALVLDVSGIKDPSELRALYDFFHPTIRNLATCGRVLVIGTDPAHCKSAPKAAANRALEGFVRSVGKEIGKKGGTAQLLWIAPNAESQIESSVRFFLSPRSAYVSGQVVRIGKAGEIKASGNSVAPLTGKVALVTGASRGIGKSIAETLARDGAKVVVLDIPPAMEELNKVAEQIGGTPLAADITDENAPRIIADHLEDQFGGVDFVIHNAGITRDKTLGRMPEHFWDMAIAVNLTAEELIDAELTKRDLLRENGRIVCVSSIAGVAGNFGQTNYGTAKAGVIGYVESMAKQLKKGCTINAVAPGFIETQMTAAMPVTIREAGRRMNSLAQGGLPVDVAETIAWYCNPLSAGVNGNVVRVCGQSLIGK